ncbi:MAG: phosphoribosyl-AMP cyclohydrolase, phosphoribosyl-ATP pyrophosphohydrolase / phosphoribosyl-AMP cyclohydrolase [Candidatus Peregrinibacteria bacterium GW2011_GWF2_39_17]|nr:MAG: phosphoribosyl-AMP cyclohydrolase, phosphoribosyl-ATP pyrophosphohydrolase / phosphoribosyl-AMP cyclohydrolase [Candidatus Peregrinibacteria bacterium GW2011_GWF2_39_17]HCW32591.1 bifunctional phosphoribosyl-AMP cyclohydrolase/phosphoribosyl-ATP pyrophosphatase [Candidatus Peregrinibacteria bacterium]
MLKPNFKKSPLIPAIIQNINSLEILMLGYMNEEAYEQTQQTGQVWFYSRSKKRLWMKGETSQNVLRVMEIHLDCDQDAILILAQPAGPTCHTGEYSCFRDSVTKRFFQNENPAKENGDFLQKLFNLINDRKLKMPKGSYTTSLFEEGIYKICTKISEESGEVIKAATKETKQRLAEESADLLYHLMVLLVKKGVKFQEVITVLKGRSS